MPATGRSAFATARKLVAPLALAALAGCVGEPETHLAVDAYGVSGRSVAQLLASTDQHGPSMRGSKAHAFAGVMPKFEVTFKPRQVGAICRYDPNGKVALHTLIVLPKWREQAKASPKLARKWEAITNFAIAHELVHIAIFQREARTLETAYRSMTAPDCKTLDARMRRETVRISEATLATHKAFDSYDYPRFSAFIEMVDAY